MTASTSIVAPAPLPLRRVAYAAFRPLLRTGDIALSRADGGPSNRLIVLGTGSPYVHATMLGWCGSVLMLAEARQWRRFTWSHSAARSSAGRGSTTCTASAAPFALPPPGMRCCGRPARPTAGGNSCAWRRKVFGRLPPAEDNQAEADFPRDCSGLVNFACRAGGRVPRPDLPDEEVEPGHFSAASFARYLCTLYWSQEEVDATRSMP